MSNRLPPIDMGALRSSPAPRMSSGGSVRQHPYASSQRRGPPAGTTSSTSQGGFLSARDRSMPPHGSFSSFAGLELPQASVVEPAGSHTSSSESSPATSFNMPGMEADAIEARFPSYSAQSSWDATGGNDVAMYSVPSADAAFHPSPHQLEALISKFHLDSQREMVRDFSKMSTDDKLTVLFMQQLRFESQLNTFGVDFASLGPRLANIERNTAIGWTPSKSQMKLCRTFVRHYLAKPLSSYVNVGNLVRKYMRKNVERLRLRIYREDMTARVTLNQCIDEQSTQLKSAFRKSLFKSCKNKIPLKSFGRNILNNYHIPVVPDEVPIPVLGTLALLREIANPLSKKKNTKGADTGFWQLVETRLLKLYKDIGNKERVTDEKWLEWAREMIEKDARMFPVRGAELPPMSRDEISSSVGMTSGEIPDDEHGFEEPSLDDIDEDEDLDLERLHQGDGDESHDDDDYDGDVNIDRMGDLAKTA